jgi:hypothetical protein
VRLARRGYVEQPSAQERAHGFCIADPVRTFIARLVQPSQNTSIGNALLLPQVSATLILNQIQRHGGCFEGFQLLAHNNYY